MTESDREYALIGSITIFVMACVVCIISCASLSDALERLDAMKESLDAMSVRLEAVQEAQKGTQYKTFDLRDFPPVEEDQPTICAPEDLDDDPTDPYKPGGPAGETGARSAVNSTRAPLRI